MPSEPVDGHFHSEVNEKFARALAEHGLALARYDEKFLALDRALTLQAQEYRRRLDDLNIDAERARKVAEKVVGVEKFEQYVSDNRRMVDQATATLAEKIEMMSTANANIVHTHAERLLRLEESARTCAVHAQDVRTAKRTAGDRTVTIFVALFAAAVTITLFVVTAFS